MSNIVYIYIYISIYSLQKVWLFWSSRHVNWDMFKRPASIGADHFGSNQGPCGPVAQLATFRCGHCQFEFHPEKGRTYPQLHTFTQQIRVDHQMSEKHLIKYLTQHVLLAIDDFQFDSQVLIDWKKGGQKGPISTSGDRSKNCGELPCRVSRWVGVCFLGGGWGLRVYSKLEPSHLAKWRCICLKFFVFPQDMDHWNLEHHGPSHSSS